jgi:hypothetical protein
MLVGLGIFLVVVGAVVAFAVNTTVEGVDLQVLGWIIMGGGAIAIVAGAIQGAGMMSMTRNRTHSERHVSSDGQHVVEETEVR